MSGPSSTRSTGWTVLRMVLRAVSDGVDLYLAHCRRMDAWERRRARVRRARAAERRPVRGGPGARRRPDRVELVWWWRVLRARWRSRIDRLRGRQ